MDYGKEYSMHTTMKNNFVLLQFLLEKLDGVRFYSPEKCQEEEMRRFKKNAGKTSMDIKPDIETRADIERFIKAFYRNR